MSHAHHESNTCSCRIDALEPNDTCPIHGGGEWPPRCAECGRFMPWPDIPEAEGLSEDEIEDRRESVARGLGGE